MNAADLANKPAFPLPLGTCNVPEVSSGGMTLREHYAGQCFAAMLASNETTNNCEIAGQMMGQTTSEIAARVAVAFADALIAELAKPVTL